MVQQTIAPPLLRERWLPMSFQEFLTWAPEEGQAEWVDGEGIAYVSTSTRHGELADFLLHLLREFTAMFALGRVYSSQILVRLPQRPSGRMPDIFVVASDGLDHVHDQWVDGGVIFAVEFVSDESEERDLIEKRDEYAGAGIPNYLAVDARPDGWVFNLWRLNDARQYDDVEPDAIGHYRVESMAGLWIDPTWFRQETTPDVDDVLLEMVPDAYEAWIVAKIQRRRSSNDRNQ